MHLADVHVKRRVVAGRPGPPINLALSPEASCRHARTAGRKLTSQRPRRITPSVLERDGAGRVVQSATRTEGRSGAGRTIWANVCSADCSGCRVRSAHSRGMHGKATGGAHEPAIWTTGVGDDGPAADAHGGKKTIDPGL
jgi:hypothetical protein